MYEDATRDLQDLDRPDVSPANHQWATRHAFERDLLIATACLQRTDRPTTPNELKAALESWYADIDHADLYETLYTLTADGLLEETTTHQNEYHLTPSARQLLEAYVDHLEMICTGTPTTTTTISIELERPITPGDLERAYCELREKTQEVAQR